ncbi:MAG: trypsin-like peptidase domain-containing protein [Cytophagales bacterium]|nr:trypsin-like peptidase domain-containing protein [Bernardetiaceae bacterium]MDW8210541.1 trypsin-like peptidase domain-containing protein [Cytophagales bacterium]
MRKHHLTLFVSILLATYGFSQSSEAVYQNGIKSFVSIEGKRSKGSGFFVLPDVVVTNYHVIEGEGEVKIYHHKSAQEWVSNQIIGFDTKADLALLKVNGKGHPATLGNDVQEGEQVFVLGDPLGLQATFANGIVSAKRDIDDVKHLQITVPISPGSSGGPLFNLQGRIVGVVVGSVKRGQNLNFAIHVDYLKELLQNRFKEPLPLVNLLKTVTIQTQAERNDYSKEELITEVVNVINELRTTLSPHYGMPICENRVKWNDALAEAASLTLFKVQGANPMTTTTYDGQTSMERASRVGVKAQGVHEILVHGHRDIITCFKNLLSYPQYRRAIFDTRVKEIGVAQRGELWSIMLAY